MFSTTGQQTLIGIMFIRAIGKSGNGNQKMEMESSNKIDTNQCKTYD